MPQAITRRKMFASAAAAGLCFSPVLRSLLAGEEKPLFKIGACDWSIGRRQQISALELARQIGLDGVEVSFDGGPRFDLREEEVREQYLQASKEHGVDICSLAMGVLNRVPYSSDPRAEQWVEESIDVMAKIGLKLTLLAFFGKGDIKGDKKLQGNVIRRLKKVAPKAEKAGVVLGLETTLNAEEHMRILDAVGSEAVKVYYDVSNMLRRGYDIYKEIPQLGDRICRFHMKEKGHLLGEGDVDFPRVKEAIDKIGYRGWLVIEAAIVKGRGIADCYVHNQKYLRSVFPTGGKWPASGSETCPISRKSRMA